VAEKQTDQATGRIGRNLASNVFALAAIVFAILAVVLYLRPSGSGIAPIPTAAPGNNQIVNVTEALKAQGLAVEQPPGLFIPVGELDVPGQGLEINGQPGFVFLYPDAVAAQAAAEGADPNSVVPEQLAGTPAPSGERRIAQGSNVMVLLVGGDQETWQKVQNAVVSLP
jgi:hypothetical protein